MLRLRRVRDGGPRHVELLGLDQVLDVLVVLLGVGVVGSPVVGAMVGALGYADAFATISAIGIGLGVFFGYLMWRARKRFSDAITDMADVTAAFGRRMSRAQQAETASPRR